MVVPPTDITISRAQTIRPESFFKKLQQQGALTNGGMHISVAKLFPHRLMVCMGGPAGNWTPQPTMRRRIDTENKVRYTQYITLWLPTLHGPWQKAKGWGNSESTTSFDIHKIYLNSFWLQWLRLFTSSTDWITVSEVSVDMVYILG